MKTLLKISVIAGMLALFVSPARAQVVPGYSGSLTNLEGVITGTNAVYGSTTNIITLRENTGLALQEKFTKAAGENGSCGVWIYWSIDKTNYSASPSILTGTSAGATAVLLQTNWSAAQLAGLQTAMIVVTNNGVGALTNKSTFWHYWNAP